MIDKKCDLCIKLKLPNEEEKYYKIVSASLEALTKYTTYCQNEKELLMCMPDFEPVYARSFFENYSVSKDMFIIKTSKTKSRKVLYKDSIDVLLIKNSELRNIIKRHFSITIEEAEENNISKEKEEFLKELYNNFSNAKINTEIKRNNQNKLNPDNYPDLRYAKYLGSSWLSLGLIPSNMNALLDAVFENYLKRQDLILLTKKYVKDLDKNISSEEENVRLETLDRKLKKKRESNYYIRNKIEEQARKIKKESNYYLEENKTSIIKTSSLSDKEILELKIKELESNSGNEKEVAVIKEMISYMDKIDEIKKEISEINIEINNPLQKRREDKKLLKEDLERRLIDYEYYLHRLENGDITFSDAGFIITNEDMSI